MGILAVVGLSAWLLRPHSDNAEHLESGTTNGASNAPLVSPIVPVSDQNSGSKPTEDKQKNISPSITPITLLGIVQPGNQATLSVRQPSRITNVLVKEGQQVSAGQLLIQFDTAEAGPQEQSAQAGIVAARTQVEKARAGEKAQFVKADADIASAQTGVKLAQEKLRQAELGVDAARATDRADLVSAQEAVRKAEIGLQNAQKQLHSLEELDKVGGVARNDLEGARRGVEVAQSDLEVARAAVRRLREGPKPDKSNPPSREGSEVTYRVASALRDEAQARIGVAQAEAGLKAAQAAKREVGKVTTADINAAQAGVRQAEAGLSGVRTGLQSTRLTSPFEGIVGGVTAHRGEIAQPGSPLLNIVSRMGARVEALVPVRLLAQLHTGEAADIRTDGHPEKPIAAQLNTIATVAEPDGRTFRVTFRLLSPPSDLRIGQNVRIELKSNAKQYREKQSNEK